MATEQRRHAKTWYGQKHETVKKKNASHVFVRLGDEVRESLFDLGDAVKRHQTD